MSCLPTVATQATESAEALVITTFVVTKSTNKGGQAVTTSICEVYFEARGHNRCNSIRRSIILEANVSTRPSSDARPPGLKVTVFADRCRSPIPPKRGRFDRRRSRRGSDNVNKEWCSARRKPGSWDIVRYCITYLVMADLGLKWLDVPSKSKEFQ